MYKSIKPKVGYSLASDNDFQKLILHFSDLEERRFQSSDTLKKGFNWLGSKFFFYATS